MYNPRYYTQGFQSADAFANLVARNAKTDKIENCLHACLSAVSGKYDEDLLYYSPIAPNIGALAAAYGCMISLPLHPEMPDGRTYLITTFIKEHDCSHAFVVTSREVGDGFVVAVYDPSRKDRLYAAIHSSSVGVHSIKHPGVITGVYELNPVSNVTDPCDQPPVQYEIDEKGMIIYPAP